MSLIVETGAAIAGAESYASVADIDTYWTNRPNRSLSPVWAAATTAQKEGAARDATAYLDATYGEHYRGQRRGYLQGLLWPRTNTEDSDGLPLPDLPPQLVSAVCELAARALSGPLAADLDRAGMVTRVREKVDVIEKETEWAAGAPARTAYGHVDGMMAPLLTGGGVGTPRWDWR